MPPFLAISWGTPFLILAIYGFVRYFVKSSKQEKKQINWTPLESVGVTLAIYFGGQVLGATLAYIFPWLVGVDDKQIIDWLSNNIYGQFLTSVLVYLMWGLLLVWFLKRRGSNLRAVGFVKPKLKYIWYILVGFAAYFLVISFLSALLDAAVPQFNQDQKQIIGFDGASGMQLALVFTSLVILPPLIEEFMMRGFAYSGLKKGLNIYWAYFITSALFAVAHLQAGSGEPLLWSAALDTFILSLILIYLREKTGSLWTSVGLHGLKNLIAFLGLFVFHWV